MPFAYNQAALDRVRRLNDSIAKLAQERFHKYPYELNDEQYKEVMKEIRRQQREERKKAVEQAKEDIGKETWRMSTEEYIKYIAEQKEKQRLLKMTKARI